MTFVTCSRKSLSARAGLRIGMAIAMGVFAAAAHAMVPASERAVLDAIWFGTGGQLPGGTDSTWVNRGGWGLPVFLGISECGSYGVTCVVDQMGQEHISGISLEENGLTGTLPASLSDLPYLEDFDIYYNEVGGSIPTLMGLTKLKSFQVGRNLLTGIIPALSGLTSLESFAAYDNQLTGSIPSLTDLTKLQYFGVAFNQLSGSIPSLNGLSQLQSFTASFNQLTGDIPSLSGLTNVKQFWADYNQLTGPIPALSNLTKLEDFEVSSNRLSGHIPSLTNLTSLFVFYVNDNLLSGTVPSAPASLAMAALCPNRLTIVSQPAIDPAWNAATNTTPWWATPFSTNACDELFYGDFEWVNGP